MIPSLTMPRDWCLENNGKIALLDRWLPLWYDNLRDYDHAHLLWIKQGKWRQELKERELHSFRYDLIFYEVRLHVKRSRWRIK